MASQWQVVIQFFDSPNGSIFAVGVAVFAILLTLVLAWMIGRSRNKGNTVLLIGLSDAGKTLLFSRLYYKTFFSTQTSIKENKGFYKSQKLNERSKTVNIIDIPGNEKLRGKFIDQFKGQVRGIIFVVDSVNFPREVHGVAECLFDILSSKAFNKLSPEILVTCNKQDLTTSKSANVIKSQLAKEINTLRQTRAAAVKGLDEQSMTKDCVFVGQKGKDFDFADLRAIRVQFVECSAKGNADNQPDVKAVETWLDKLL